MVVTTCWNCWHDYSNTSSTQRMCPESHPYRSGGTASCGCMQPYHNIVCSMQRCCKETLQCYGNCGDYTALYIFLAVVAGLFLLGGIYCFLCHEGGEDAGQDNELAVPLPYAENNDCEETLCNINKVETEPSAPTKSSHQSDIGP